MLISLGELLFCKVAGRLGGQDRLSDGRWPGLAQQRVEQGTFERLSGDREPSAAPATTKAVDIA
jgi:hypothetical protein